MSDWTSELSVGKNEERVGNPFSGQSVVLKPLEVAVYDYIKGCEATNQWNEMQKGLDWFRSKNPAAYMILLD